MKKNIYFLIILLCSISFIRVLFTLNEENIYISKDMNISAIVTKIKKDKEKTVIDVRHGKKYRITFYKQINVNLGDKVLISGKFNTPKSNTVFNTFNYRKYLLSKKIILVSNEASITIKHKNKNPFYSFKTSIKNHIEKYKSKAYLKAFIMGDTSLIEEDIMSNYKMLGINHLFAISGMHVSVFVFLINKLLKKYKVKDIIIILFLLLFLFITDYSESLLRCSTFFIISYLNKVLKLNIKNIYLILISAFFLLLINPYLIYSIGFLFSVIITFFILASSNLLKDKPYFKKLFIMSLICFLASVPILSFYFYKINLLTIVFNMIFIPLVSYLTFPLGLITFFLYPLDNIYMFFINLLEGLSSFFQNINFLSFVIAKPNIFVILIYYIILFLSIKRNRKLLIIYFIVLLININIKYFIRDASVTFLDVGQGDSSVIILPFGKTILIDTGGLYLSRYNISKNKTVPYLNSLGISKIDILILTHGDYDHMGEAINLVNNFKVKKVIFNCGEFNDLEKKLIKVLDKKKIKYYSCIKELNIDNNKLYFLQTKEYDNENDNSNVIYTELDGYKFMFMGDAGIDKEKDILDKYNLSNVDVLKVGHHGSKTSTGSSFIKKINPKYSIISVGENNRYGHPNNEALKNLANSKIYRTDLDGSIEIKLNKNGYKIRTCPP
ncbi:dNA internalization competence protein ComEC/Rec2-like protein [Clostridium sp. CAG:594]|nr:dNA internalization competence protein ComEC/Rec2-like protein [Clostridium sp. CAG:594]